MLLLLLFLGLQTALVGLSASHRLQDLVGGGHLVHSLLAASFFVRVALQQQPAVGGLEGEVVVLGSHLQNGE